MGNNGAAETRMDDREYELELYKVYREKVTHEDGLVNQRVFWMVTFESLLFTAFSLMAENGFDDPKVVTLTAIFAVVGIFFAFITLFSVIAAFNSIDATAHRWRTCLGEERFALSPFPSLVGDADNLAKIGDAARKDKSRTSRGGAHFMGKYAGWFLPPIIIAAWIGVLLVVRGWL